MRAATRRIAVVTAGVLLAGVLSSCGGSRDPRYQDTLHKFRGGSSLENKVVKLTEGDRFSVGSPDGHDLVVQRYDARSRGWSTPTVVHTERQWTHDVSLVHRHGTVAIGADYWRQRVLDDDYAPDHTVGVVCAGPDCTRSYPLRGLGGPSITSDGSYVTFRDRNGVVVWAGGQLHREPVIGLPSKRFSAAMQADGSFRAVTSSRVRGGCRWTLSTSKPHSLAFTEQVTSSVHPADDETCPVWTEPAGDRVAVFVDAMSGSVEFEQAGGTWREVPQPVGHEDIADTGGRSTIAPVFHRGRRPDDQSQVLYSPDNHRIMTQYDSPYASAWSKPQTVLTTDDDTPCRRASFVSDDHDTEIARVRCWSGGPDAGLDPATPSEETVVLVSLNGGTAWTAVQVHDAGRIAASKAGLPLLVAGRPAAATTEEGDRVDVRLPMEDPAHDALGVDYDKRVTRVRVLPRDGGCAALVQTARLEDDAWGPAATTRLPAVRRSAAGRCPDATLAWSDLRLNAIVDGHTWDVDPRSGRLTQRR